MSHFSKMNDVQIVDPKAFEESGKELGFKVTNNTKIKAYDGTKILCDVAISTGTYDVGLVKEGSSYRMVADWWGVQREKDLPQKYRQALRGNSEKDHQDVFKRYTTKNTIVNKYRKQGYRVNVKEEGQKLIVNMEKF